MQRVGNERLLVNEIVHRARVGTTSISKKTVWISKNRTLTTRLRSIESSLCPRSSSFPTLRFRSNPCLRCFDIADYLRGTVRCDVLQAEAIAKQHGVGTVTHFDDSQNIARFNPEHGDVTRYPGDVSAQFPFFSTRSELGMEGGAA